MSGAGIEPASWKQFIAAGSFAAPGSLPPSAWTEHIPFAHWLMEAARPALFIELGTHAGLSYFTFCRAIRENNLRTRCFAIDNWLGDMHAGFYDSGIFESVQQLNEEYSEFSTLCRSAFDEAVSLFSDGAIDLLHIDGLHTYEAVKNDFYKWLPKLSERAIVLFHDTNVKDRGFGVFRLWQELQQVYPSFEFTHGYGLGVIGTGKKTPALLTALFEAGRQPATRFQVRKAYERLGYLSRIEQEYYHLKEVLSGGNLVENNNPLEDEQTIGGAEQLKKILQQQNLRAVPQVALQLYWAKEGEDFAEADSTIQTVQLTDEIAACHFETAAGFGPVQRLRIDPGFEQGAFYLHDLSIVGQGGKLLASLDTLNRHTVSCNLVLLKSSLLEGVFLMLATNYDPIIEVDIASSGSTMLVDDALQVSLAVSKIEDASLQIELTNITIRELNPPLLEQPDNCPKETFRAVQ